jgi:hypothetical protein
VLRLAEVPQPELPRPLDQRPLKLVIGFSNSLGVPISARSIHFPLSTAFTWTALQAALFWPLLILTLNPRRIRVSLSPSGDGFRAGRVVNDALCERRLAPLLRKHDEHVPKSLIVDQ